MTILQHEGHYDPEVLSSADDLAFWSTPFGLRLLDVVHYEKQMRVLDLACGAGFPLIELAMRLGRTSRVYGVDPWSDGILMAARKIMAHRVTNAEVIQARAEDLPFREAFFDLAVSNNGVNNVSNLELTFDELRRVLKTGAQFAFTFNTDRTFEQFYDVFRDVLTGMGLHQYVKSIEDHIYKKRKPISVFIELLESKGFHLISVHKDSFSYHFADGTAMLNHSFIKHSFFPSWTEILDEEHRKPVFERIEQSLNALVEKSGPLTMPVPFLIVNSERT